MYRYREWRNKFVNDFLGDFLIYQNPERGKLIRKTVFEQLNQFLYDHSGCDEIHFVAHSLGSLILWDLLFSDVIGNDDPALLLREKLSQVRLASITTLGSPLLFLKQFFDLDFSGVDTFLKKLNTENNTNSCKLRWVNIIHSSDLVAYPLKAAIENKVGNNLLYYDQYVWQCANGGEQTLRNLGQFDLAMVFAAEDAHSSYFYDNIDGTITGRIIAYNLIGDTQKLAERCVTPK
ncbi:hypothetical protein C7B76_27725 [filamentous cyanobacterium CCP2]|nr:hypothetical protein C7B76_27725 [filamentous cyanobacterium CCP2]